MPQPVGGRPCYQKVKFRQRAGDSDVASDKVALMQVYLFWCSRGARWKIGDRPNPSCKSFARSPLDYRRPELPNITGTWLVRRGEGADAEWEEDALFRVVRIAPATQ
mmetsp:Transcript_97126/g.279561  ORF Transcript_97126/g.279561 Transcript_97126/m.279561 type:complete len:107 (+) Transcript_97126:2172-2492(+)